MVVLYGWPTGEASNPWYWLLRVFSRLGSTVPFADPHILGINQAYAQFRQAGAELFMLTSLGRREAQAVVEDLQLTLPLLADETGQSFKTYFTGQALGAPLPGQFVLDVQGRLRYAHLFSFLDHNAAPETLLAVLETL
ncbi:MAG: peroxiredoxin family protein [Nodosilinea sp. LVE1205-7]|jgi:peroxiredoxin